MEQYEQTYTSHVPANRPLHALSCIMGNQGKMAGNSKVCMGFQSQLILPESIYLKLPL